MGVDRTTREPTRACVRRLRRVAFRTVIAVTVVTRAAASSSPVAGHRTDGRAGGSAGLVAAYCQDRRLRVTAG